MILHSTLTPNSLFHSANSGRSVIGVHIGFQITWSTCIYFESRDVCVQTSMEYFLSNTDNSQTAKKFLVPGIHSECICPWKIEP